MMSDSESPLSTSVDELVMTPPSGPTARDRRQRLTEQHESAEATEERIASRLSGGRERGPVSGARSSEAAAPRGDGTLAEEKGVAGPLGERRILYSEKPHYPDWARRIGLEAEVRFRFWVTPQGTVDRVEYITFSGSSQLDRLAEKTLRKWKFEPLPRGVPQKDEWGIIPMSFTLIPGNG